MPRFWNWIAASEDTENRAVLVLSGAIDSSTSWYEDTVTPSAFREELDAHAGESIQVEINSPGGDVFAGFEIYNMLRGHNGSVRVRVTGMAASAASIVAMAADPGALCMCEASMMMIHNPWTWAGGNSTELREQADVLDMIRDVMVSCYMHRFCGEQTDLEAMLDRETWLTPQRAMEHGLCDEIETAEDGGGEDVLSASAMAGRYAAMSRAQMEEIRERFGAKKPAAAGTSSVPDGTPVCSSLHPPLAAAEQTPSGKAMAADEAAKLLREADAMIADAFRF